MSDTRTIRYGDKDYTVSAAHPAADALPLKLDTDEFRDIVASMASDGFDPEKPIYRQAATGRVISGRRRELASQVAGVETVYVDKGWTDAEVVAFVERDELHRRNLTPSEKAASAVELAALKPHGGDRKSEAARDQAATSPLDPAAADQARSREAIAKGAGVGERTVRAVAAVREKSESLFAAVKEGEIGAQLAERLVKKASPRQIKQVLAADDKSQAANKVLRQVEEAARREADSPGGQEGEPGLDDRFMPNAADARALAMAFGFAISGLRSAHRGLMNNLRDRDHPLAKRIDLHGNFASQLLALIETLERNLPELPCPPCCGTGETGDGKSCRHCQGYGVVDRGFYDGNKAVWPKVEKRMQQLRANADAGDAA
ncbi:ParB/RepB/Spo0J family partition protein [Limnoglobus roseus]|uniref:ParB/Sulfiredoxin domain-containing protein n=1 Tax=Limnoglobus roseus TaxID=2598579 RepID=A0A5C1AJ66_9BACT|nr:ParB/RepB/Spo0J family partition protein [Limnoglobus roseus]QEL19499.1 hypothetical protein PX52LOC_06573 [Limnoglobus roseus]